MSSSLSHMSDQDRYVKSQILAAGPFHMGERETLSETTVRNTTHACAKLNGNEAKPIIRPLRSSAKLKYPPAGAEPLQDSAGKSQFSIQATHFQTHIVEFPMFGWRSWLRIGRRCLMRFSVRFWHSRRYRGTKAVTLTTRRRSMMAKRFRADVTASAKNLARSFNER